MARLHRLAAAGTAALVVLAGGSTAAQEGGAGSRPTTFQNLNPEIGVVGDIVGNASSLPAPPDEEDALVDRFAFREAEIVFGSFVDPFARADFAFVFSDLEGPEIEEAFITFFNLPWKFRGKAGKFRSKIGRVNLIDLNALPFVDEPLVIEQYFGPEGFAETGVQVGHLIPAGPVFLEVTAEFLNGGTSEEEPVAIASNPSDPTYVAHLRTYYDFTTRSNLEFGLTWVYANDNHLEEEDPATGAVILSDDFATSVYGADLTYRYRKNKNRDVLLRFEGYRVDRDLAAFRAEGTGKQDGFYLHGQMRFHPKWSAGARYDLVEPLFFDVPPDEKVHSDTQSLAAFVTYEQSEFARFRLQAQRTRLPDGAVNNEFFLQIRFQIGIDRHGLQ